MVNVQSVWKAPQYISEIGEALVKTGDAKWLYYAGKEWSEERYITPIADALIQTENTECLTKAGKKRYVSLKNRRRGLTPRARTAIMSKESVFC